MVTVHRIFKNEAPGVGKGILGIVKRDAMFFNVDPVFGFTPLKFHYLFLIHVCIVVNIFIWSITDDPHLSSKARAMIGNS